MKRFFAWLNQFLNTPITRSTEMSDEQIVQSGAQAAPADAAAPAIAVIGVDGALTQVESLSAPIPASVAAAAAPAVSDFDAFAAKLKAALKVAEVDVEHVWEEAVALAKKLV